MWIDNNRNQLFGDLQISRTSRDNLSLSRVFACSIIPSPLPLPPPQTFLSKFTDVAPSIVNGTSSSPIVSIL